MILKKLIGADINQQTHEYGSKTVKTYKITFWLGVDSHPTSYDFGYLKHLGLTHNIPTFMAQVVPDMDVSKSPHL